MEDYHYSINGSPAPDGFEPDRKQKSGFGKGVLVGVLCTLLVTFLTMAATVGVHGVRDYLRQEQQRQKQEETAKNGSRAEDLKKGSNSGADAQEKIPLGEITEKLRELQGYIEGSYLFDYDPQKLADAIYYGMLYGLGDPYSYYYTEEEFASLQESYTGEYYGIGILVQQDPETGEVTILRVFDGPAKEAGIQKGDVLYRVEDLMVGEEDLNTVIARIKGKEGTTVNVEVYRKSSDEYIAMNVERRQVVTEDVDYQMLEDQIGYILLDQFEGKAAEQLKAAIADLENQGMQGLILDLRDNPGGDLDVMLEIADIFLPPGVVLTIEDVHGYSIPYYSGEQQFTKPLVVLVNGNSASASEAFSGAVKDYGTGTLVGTQTFGKGIVQSIFTLRDKKTAIRLTTAHYYTPGGICIHGTGISPDVVVEWEEGDTDRQLQEGISVIKDLLR